MFERFTRDALQVVARADDEARSIGFAAIGSEHLLLGVLGHSDDIAATVLAAAGVTVDSARAEMLRHISLGEGRLEGRVWLAFTPRATEVLEAALSETERLNSTCVAPAHLLLGVTVVGDGLAARILREHRIGLSALATDVELALADHPGA